MEIAEILKLDKPICFFDCETTGLNVAQDRIVSISVIKIMPDSSIEKKYSLINPTIPIPKECSDVHGITDDMVADKPLFKNLAKGIYNFMKDCYIGGYNNNFYDNAILQEEFFRCGIDFPNEEVLSVDACQIFKSMEKRDLTSAVKFYCNEEMVNAHNSEADNEATIKVFLAQVLRYDELRDKTIPEIAQFCKVDNRVDWQSKIVRDADGDYCYNFGNSKGQKVKDNVGFAKWILEKDFPETLKNLLRKIITEISNKK